jgi:DMSO/TMAO reductase YedYZ heme-binding membrane subunit
MGIGMVAILIDPDLLSGAAAGSERAGRAVVAFLDFYCGVFTLVSLSLAVMGGVLAMDRIVLQPRHRMKAQLLHRAVAMASVGFLIGHVMLQVLDGHVGPLDAAIPFLAGGRTLFIGFGTIAAQLMLLLAATGIARGRFAYRSRPALWRVIHVLAYLCWPIALLHGLQAGRSPKPWVTASYNVCVALIVVALLVRVVTARRRRARGTKLSRTTTKEPRIPRPGAAPTWAAGPSVDAVAARPRTPLAALEHRPGLGPVFRGEIMDPVSPPAAVSRRRQPGPVGRYESADPVPPYGVRGPVSRYGRPDPVGRYDEPDAGGHHDPPDARGRHGPPDDVGRYGQPDAVGRYGRSDSVGRYAQPHPVGSPGVDEFWDFLRSTGNDGGAGHGRR